MKKVFCIVLSISMVLLFVPHAYAEGSISDTTTLNQVISYAYNSIPDLAKLPDVTFPEDGVYISQPIHIYDYDEVPSFVFFLFDQNTCFGEFIVSCIDGELYSSFLYSDLPVVSNAYANSLSFYLLAIDGVLLMCTSTTMEIVVGNGVLDEQLEGKVADYRSTEGSNNFQSQEVTLTFIPPVVTPRFSGLPATSRSLDVPLVDNAHDPNGNGLCWAAAAASTISYLQGVSTVDALSVYNTVVIDLGGALGYSETVEYALLAFGISGYTTSNDSISVSMATSLINAGYPVIISIGIAPGVGDYCHFVVFCGYMFESDGTDYIQIVDSNVDTGRIWISFNRNTNSIRYVTPYNLVYTEWFETIYYGGAV